MVDFIFLSNVIYITKIVANKLATWKYTNDYGKNIAASEKVVGIKGYIFRTRVRYGQEVASPPSRSSWSSHSQ